MASSNISQISASILGDKIIQIIYQILNNLKIGYYDYLNNQEHVCTNSTPKEYSF